MVLREAAQTWGMGGRQEKSDLRHEPYLKQLLDVEFGPRDGSAWEPGGLLERKACASAHGDIGEVVGCYSMWPSPRPIAALLPGHHHGISGDHALCELQQTLPYLVLEFTHRIAFYSETSPYKTCRDFGGERSRDLKKHTQKNLLRIKGKSPWNSPHYLWLIKIKFVRRETRGEATGAPRNHDFAKRDEAACNVPAKHFLL